MLLCVVLFYNMSNNIFKPATPILTSDKNKKQTPKIKTAVNQVQYESESEDSLKSDELGFDELSVVENTKRIITSEDTFWNFVEKLYWRDKSEDPSFSVNEKRRMIKSLSIVDQEVFADRLMSCVQHLNSALTDKNFYPDWLNQSERNAICSHIVGKGYGFYMVALVDDPGFAAYLIPENETAKKEYFDMLLVVSP